jgi:opacity protein-like surface antigen
MKKFGLFAVAAAVACAAAPAVAAPVIDFNGISGTFGNTNIAAGSFDNTFNFSVSDNGIVGATITSIAVSALTDVDFTSVSLNGVEFTNEISDGAGIGREFRSIGALTVASGSQTLRVRGNSGGNGAYAGTLAFTAQAVPEPAGWTTMVLALGLLGGALKLSRRKGMTPATA